MRCSPPTSGSRPPAASPRGQPALLVTGRCDGVAARGVSPRCASAPNARPRHAHTDAWTATYHRVDYDIDRAANAIADTDLPEHLGRRLYVGQ